MGRAVEQLALESGEFELAEEEGDLVIDFSSPEGTRHAIELGKPLVCGTTGLPEEIFASMEDLATRVPVLYSPNFSLGMALMLEVVEVFAEKFNRVSQVSIEEVHHTQKRDTPSGTARKLGALLHSDAIVSKREGEVIGIHQVNLSLDGQQLSIRHEAQSRRAFAQGALLGAKFLLNRPPKIYQLREVLG